MERTRRRLRYKQAADHAGGSLARLLSHLRHQLLVLLLEPGADPLAVLQELLGALCQARVLSVRQVLRCEVCYTVVEASVHQRGVESHEVGHLLLFNDLLELLLFVIVELIHDVVVSLCGVWLSVLSVLYSCLFPGFSSSFLLVIAKWQSRLEKRKGERFDENWMMAVHGCAIW